VTVPNSPQAWSGRASAPSSWEAAGWTRGGQHTRFAAVLSALNPVSGEKLLDWGCGTGALSELLPHDVAYYGFDWADGMVKRARGDHPGRRFSTHPPARYERFDVVACVGPFNLPDGWSKQRTFAVLRHLWDTTRCRALAVSLYSGSDARCLIYTEAETEACARDLSASYEVTRHRANDLLMVARR
jgi:hypothetical protein